jgi:hypothetical protein
MRSSVYLLGIATLFCSTTLCNAQASDVFLAPDQVNIDAFFTETQKATADPGRVDTVWWIPTIFWLITNSQDPTVSQSDFEDLARVLDPFIIIGTVAGNIGPFGGVSFRSKAEVEEHLTCITSEGKQLKIVGMDEVNADVKNLLSVLKPVLTNVVGPMGENMHFFLFPSRDESGSFYADPTMNGFFSIELGNDTYTWKLPLASLLTPKTCPKCGEELSGAWAYCPWDGATLPENK